MKTGWKKFVIWAAVISTLLGTVVGSQVMAIKTSEALEQMKEAGKIQLVANVFSKCVTKSIDMGLTNILYDYAEVGVGDIFMNTNWTNTEIPTGAWLENQVQGKVNNGTIYCDDNDSKIFDVFANTFGVSQEEVLCNGEKPGIVKLQTQDSDGKWKDVTNYCVSGLGNSDYQFVWNTEKEALKHLKKLYNNKKNKNQYLVGWDDRGTFDDDLTNYFLYFNDFTTACSTGEPFSGDESLMNKTKYYGPVKVPNPSNGKMEERYYPKGGASKYGDWECSWVSKKAGAHTCDGAIKRINETAPAVKKALDKTEKDKDENGNDATPDDIVGDITDDANNNGGSTEQASLCSTAASSLGWIICPVIQGVGAATDWMYDYIENNYLQTDADFAATYEKDESGKDKEDDSGNKIHTGTYMAWTSFRDIANIVFVIAIVVIILSQITGFGVSNYGIKKMLPSLILVAVLVNLSFFLCQVAVDLSNIVGYGVKQVFVGLGGPKSEFGEGSLGDIIGSVDGGSGVLAGLLGTGGVVALVATAPKWIWPFLVLLLGAAISVMFFFLLLGIRQAGIIVLIALSPVAIICYALPNTKNIFSRWWKIFSALLLVYPICGALMGGGQFASKLLLANVSESTGFFYILIAMLIQTVPFFFVPSILKSSMAAMGNLGMKLSSLGRSLSRGTTGLVRKSDGYKYRVARTQARSAKRALSRQEWRDKHGLSVRGRASKWAGRGGVRGFIGDSAEESRNRSQERRINAVAAQRRAEQNAAFVAQQGLTDAERRERDTAMKNYEAGYRGDDAFMTSFAAQSSAYEDAIAAVDRNPNDMNAIAQLRALQNVLGTSADGQDIIQNVLHRRLAADQASGVTTVSAGLKAAGQTLISDHGGFKSGNRGLNKLAADLGDGKALDSNRGRYLATALKDSNGNLLKDKAGNQIYENNHYGAAGAKGAATELAGANDSTLNAMLSSIQNGNMSAGDMEAAYRNASEAITNDNISVKPENEGLLNQIRQAAYDKLQGQQVGGYTDSTGREFAHAGGNNYQYTDSSGNVHNYTRSGSGDLTEVGGSDVVNNSDLTSMSQNYYDDQGRKFVSNGSGTYTYDDGTTKHTYTRNSTTGDFTEVGTGSEVITGNRMKTAADNFGFNYGDGYRNLHAGDTFKVGHNAPATPTKVNLPAGWTLTNSGWVDITTGRPLSPMDARRADSIVDHNNKIDNNS